MGNVDGESINDRAKFMWSGVNDAIIFDPDSNTYYELKDYKKHNDGKLRPASITTVPGRILWRHEIDADGTDLYCAYIDGEKIHTRTRFMWSGVNDAIIFDPDSNTYYELKDYRKHNDGKLRPAEIFQF